MKRSLILFWCFCSVFRLLGQCSSIDVDDVTIDDAQSVELKASNGSSTCTFNWYSSEGYKVGASCDFTTPNLSCGATYYVEDTAVVVNTPLIAGYQLSDLASELSFDQSYYTVNFDAEYAMT